MKSLFLPEILRGTAATLVLTVLCGGLYPALVWGLGQAVFPTQANGSVMRDASGKIVGSSLLGRNFNGPQYFHPRPSAAGPDGYDVKASSGSNLGPTSQKLADALRERIAAYRTENSLAADASVPSDAVTSSASGLDPHISPANAALQARRVAAARGVPVEAVERLIRQHTLGPDLGLFGEARVNVVTLNPALDALK